MVEILEILEILEVGRDFRDFIQSPKTLESPKLFLNLYYFFNETLYSKRFWRFWRFVENSKLFFVQRFWRFGEILEI